DWELCDPNLIPIGTTMAWFIGIDDLVRSDKLQKSVTKEEKTRD
ncbi:hypothetical protein AKJ16_DCAP08055, partial [Drosera capensis]